MGYQKSEETRERINAAASELFNEYGFTNVSLLDISKKAGISRTTLYYYYESKFAIADHFVDVLIEKITSATEEWTKKDRPLLQIAIMPYYVLFKEIEKSLPSFETYFVGFEYENRGAKYIKNIKKKYSFPATWKLFEEYHQPLSEDEQTAILLAGNAIWRSFFKAAAKKTLNFSSRQILDYLFRATILDRLNIPLETYHCHADEVERFLHEFYPF